MQSGLVSRLECSLSAHGLVAEGDHLLLAVSGGADSVALLVAMNALSSTVGFRITVAHLDHRMRGTTSRADAAFVESLSRQLDLPCVLGQADVRRLARRKHVSIEMAAREARYRFLSRTARTVGATAIATAHTGDDQAETVLLKLARGAGATGLGGIRRRSLVSELGIRIPHSRIALLRPLLDVSRTEIERFLRQQGQAWREDESNASAAFLRNRVRHEILPLIEDRLNPSVRTALRRTADILGEEDAWLEGLAEDALTGDRGPDGQLDRSSLGELPLPLRRRVIRRWLTGQGVPEDRVDFGAVERVVALAEQSRGSRAAALKGPWQVVRRYEMLAVMPVGGAEGPFRVALTAPGETLLPEQGLRVVISNEPGIVTESGKQPGRMPACASLSRKAIARRRLYLRTPRPGDRMQPYGMQGSKKLQDIFVDAKVPADRRAAIPVLECGGKIAWIPGYRIAHAFRVREGQAPILRVHLYRL